MPHTPAEPSARSTHQSFGCVTPTQTHSYSWDAEAKALTAFNAVALLDQAGDTDASERVAELESGS